MEFIGRRSAVHAIHGVTASSQPLASEIGLSILKQGGNAADAAVGMAAALNVTEPCSTGIGGDCFCLYYEAKTGKVHGVNGSGRTPAALTIERAKADLKTDGDLPIYHHHGITVPGTASGWVDTIEKFGTWSLDKVLEPAIKMAEEGFPVHEVAANGWKSGSFLLKADNNPHGKDMLMPNGEAPKSGEIMKMPLLAKTFRELAKNGKKGFYEGRIAEAIVATIQGLGGVMTLEDLKSHKTTFEDPISVNYRGVDVFEIAPSGQGITALMALNILSEFDLSKMDHNGPEYLHHLIESLRLSFADTLWYVTDPEKYPVPTEGMLSKAYAKERRAKMSPDKAMVDPEVGSPQNSSDTVYFTVVDGEGNACSFINSNYMGFGTGLVPKDCGFTLQNRAAKMPLNKEHPNCLAPGKRPYHTIIPGMAVKDGQLYCSFGVMGGYMQPQGHVQVMCNMLDFGMNPQQALDAARFCIGPGHTGAKGAIELEQGITDETISKLKEMGHVIGDSTPVHGNARALFGRGQIVACRHQPDSDTIKRVLTAGSDPRADGCAMGW